MSLDLSYNLKRTLSKCVLTSSRWSWKTQPAWTISWFLKRSGTKLRSHNIFSEITSRPQSHHFAPVCFHATSCLCANWAYSDSSRHEMHRKTASFTFKDLYPTYRICCHHHFVVNSSLLHPLLSHLQEKTRVRVRLGKKAFHTGFHITSVNSIVKPSLNKVLFFILSVYSWYKVRDTYTVFLHWPISYCVTETWNIPLEQLINSVPQSTSCSPVWMEILTCALWGNIMKRLHVKFFRVLCRKICIFFACLYTKTRTHRWEFEKKNPTHTHTEFYCKTLIRT